MNAERIQRSINRMAYQIAEDNRGEHAITVVGLKERGHAVAHQICECLTPLAANDVHLCTSDELKNDTTGYTIVVDDVIFSGRTMLGAIRDISRTASPSILRTAVLVDRGHRKQPVEATFWGLELPTKLDEHVKVITDEKGAKKVVLTNTPD